VRRSSIPSSRCATSDRHSGISSHASLLTTAGEFGLHLDASVVVPFSRLQILAGRKFFRLVASMFASQLTIFYRQ
jgi:hypothetical protein